MKIHALSRACFTAVSIALFLFYASDASGHRARLKDDGLNLSVSKSANKSPQPKAPGFSAARELSKMPLRFEAAPTEQESARAFFARGSGYGLSLTAAETVLRLKYGEDEQALTSYRNLRYAIKVKPDTQNAASDAASGERFNGLRSEEQVVKPSPDYDVLRMRLIGANEGAPGQGLDPLPGRSNYFRGRDSRKWRVGAPQFARVKFNDVYPGVSLVYYGRQSQLEYDFIVRAGADPKRIELAFDGAERIEIEKNGDLALRTKHGVVKQQRPFVYQEVAGARAQVKGEYVKLADDRIGFNIGAYDPAKPLVIDPVLSYSTFLGGSGEDSVVALTTDKDGNLYVAGVTYSDDFPIVNGAFTKRAIAEFSRCFGGCVDLFVAKINPAGTALIYSTYLGGGYIDEVFGIAVDRDGAAYITGASQSDDFPVTIDAFQRTLKGTRDAIVVKLSPAGDRLVYSTYLGGWYNERGLSIAVDSAGSAYVAGRTVSSDFPTRKPFQAAIKYPDDQDGFVTKLSPDGSSLVYSTLLGGERDDECLAIAVDAAGCAYATGGTFSVDFPAINALQPYANIVRPPNSEFIFADLFVTKFNPDGSTPVYSTPLGSTRGEVGASIAVDEKGQVVIGGLFVTDGIYEFPMVNPIQRETPYLPGLGFATDCLIVKLDETGRRLLFSTLLGGSQTESINNSITVDRNGRIYVSATTNSYDLPITPDALQPKFGLGLSDSFVAVIDPARVGTDALVYCSYLGGGMHESDSGVALDGAGNIYVAGRTQRCPDCENTFPLVNPMQNAAKGTADGYIVKISPKLNNSGDAIPPVVVINDPSTPEYNTDSVKINLRGVATDNASVARVSWVNDRGGWGIAEGVGQWEIKGLALRDGANKVTVTALDSSGNTGGAAVTINYRPEYLINRVLENAGPAVTVDAAGNIYFSVYLKDYESLVRKLSVDGTIATIGGGGQTLGDGGPATSAKISAVAALLVDKDGNVYVADWYDNRVRKIAPNGVITTIAGAGQPGIGGYGGDGGPATEALFNRPFGLAMDAEGNLYISDVLNNRIRKVSKAGVVTTFAGVGDCSGAHGDGGPARDAVVCGPNQLAFDCNNNLYVSQGSGFIRKITPAGVISTVAGNVTPSGYPRPYLDNVPATQAYLFGPGGVAVDCAGNIYISEPEGGRIRRVDASGIIKSIAGDGGYGYFGDGGAALAARLLAPANLAFDRSGDLLVGDGMMIRKLFLVSRQSSAPLTINITSPAPGGGYNSRLPFAVLGGRTSGNVFHVRWRNDRGGSGVASGLNPWIVDQIPLQEGSNQITVTAVGVTGSAASATLNVSYTADKIAPALTIISPNPAGTYRTTRPKVTINGAVADNAGVALLSWQNDRGEFGQIEPRPNWSINDLLLREGVSNFTITAEDFAGNRSSVKLVVDYAPEYLITTVAGGGSLGSNVLDREVPAPNAALYEARNIALGPQGDLYIAGLYQVLQLRPDGIIAPLIGVEGAGVCGSLNSAQSGQPSPGQPQSVAVDKQGNIYVGACARVLKINPQGQVSVFAGGGTSFEDGPATQAALGSITGMTFDAAGNLYLATGRVMKITPDGRISTLAGGVNDCFAVVTNNGDGGPARSASVCAQDVALDKDGNIFAAEGFRGRIRKIDKNGVINTVAGNGKVPPLGSAEPLGDGGPAIDAYLYTPFAIVFDKAGRLLIADFGSSRIRRVNSAGVIESIAGSSYLYNTGSAGNFRGDGGAATWAELSGPRDLVVDESNNIYFIDFLNRRVRKLTPYASRQQTSVSSASYLAGALAPDSIVSAFGVDLAPGAQAASSLPLPATLGGSQVQVKDVFGVQRLARLFYVSPTQVNYLLPAGTAQGEATITIVNGSGSASLGTVRVARVAPGIFSANANGAGVAAGVALRLKSDGTQVYEPIAQFDPAQNKFVARPIDLGPDAGAATDQVFLLLFGTGIRNRSSLSTVTANIGGINAEVLYAGMQGDFAGLDQVNIRLQRSLIGRGDVSIQLNVEGKTANPLQIKVK